MNANIIDVKRQINKNEYISPSRLRLWLKCPLAYKLLCGPPHNSFNVVFRVMWRSTVYYSGAALLVSPNAT